MTALTRSRLSLKKDLRVLILSFDLGEEGVGVFRGRGCKKGAILRKCLNTFVLHCGLINLQAYKSCYASQRETVAKCYV